jgi:hypothetical protein
MENSAILDMLANELIDEMNKNIFGLRRAAILDLFKGVSQSDHDFTII